MNKLCLIFAAAAFPFAAAAADLNAEIATAAQHAELASQASDIAGVHTHLHHTLNCLVGPKGDGFDPKELNPCANSGNGAIPDAANDAAKLRTLKSAASNAQVGLRENNLFTAKATAAHLAKKLQAIH